MDIMQLPLPIRLKNDARFDNFYQPLASSQEKAVAGLQAFLADEHSQVFYLCGSSGSGVTHLLQAVCHQQQDVQYFPLQELKDYPAAEILEGLEQLACVCIDQLDAVVGNEDWEQSLFHCFNRLRDAGGKLIVGASQPPLSLGVTLPDLLSRLSWGGVFQLELFSDELCGQALQWRAECLGLELSDEVARFLLQRGSRDMSDLLGYLRQLDDASLAQQRRLTIPFVKQVLSL